MSDEHKCGCEAGYRDVVTGDLKAYAAGERGVGLEIATDPCGTMYLGSDRDEAWAKAHLGKHLAVTITQFPDRGPMVVDIGILEGRASDLARTAARVGMALGSEIWKGAGGEWHVRVPTDYPKFKELGGTNVIHLTDEMLEIVDKRIQQLKRAHDSDQR
jgi:hypothetical protein